jgi:hypothetical protein
VNTETTKLMQDALQAAVTRINNGSAGSAGSAEPQAGPADTIGAVMSVLPKLLRNNESSEDLLEKLDALQTGGLTPLREQMQILRKRSSLMLKSQEQLVAKVDELQRQQSAIARVVLDLARQMARITLVEEVPTGDDDDEREAPPAPESYRRAEFRTNGDGRGRSQRENQTVQSPRSQAGRSR